MKCPLCKAETYVRETRDVRRRRQCSGCGHRFSTVETIFHGPVKEQVDKPVAQPPKPKAVKPVAQVKKAAQARRILEERRDQRRSSYNPFDDDNDFLPSRY